MSDDLSILDWANKEKILSCIIIYDNSRYTSK